MERQTAMIWTVRGDKASSLRFYRDQDRALAAAASRDQRPARPWKDHYDLPDAKRQAAISRGARPITCREATEMLRAKRLAHRETATRDAQ